jgi:hypothetical protein
VIQRCRGELHVTCCAVVIGDTAAKPVNLADVSGGRINFGSVFIFQTSPHRTLRWCVRQPRGTLEPHTLFALDSSAAHSSASISRIGFRRCGRFRPAWPAGRELFSSQRARDHVGCPFHYCVTTHASKIVRERPVFFVSIFLHVQWLGFSSCAYAGPHPLIRRIINLTHPGPGCSPHRGLLDLQFFRLAGQQELTILCPVLHTDESKSSWRTINFSRRLRRPRIWRTSGLHYAHDQEDGTI